MSIRVYRNWERIWHTGKSSNFDAEMASKGGPQIQSNSKKHIYKNIRVRSSPGNTQRRAGNDRTTNHGWQSFAWFCYFKFANCMVSWPLPWWPQDYAVIKSRLLIRCHWQCQCKKKARRTSRHKEGCREAAPGDNSFLRTYISAPSWTSVAWLT